MKNTTQCPKCKGREIFKVPFSKDNFGQNAVMTGFFAAAKVIRYVCGSCGYTEEWIDNMAELDKLNEKFKDSKL